MGYSRSKVISMAAIDTLPVKRVSDEEMTFLFVKESFEIHEQE